MELDEAAIALRSTEPILVGRMERVIRQLTSEFKGGKLTQDRIVSLRADYEAARSLLSNLTEAAGGRIDG